MATPLNTASCGTPAPSRSRRLEDPSDRFEEACGVFGVLAARQEVANLAYFGLYALQHRGQESAGMAVFDADRVRLHKDMGLVANVFDKELLLRLHGSLAIGHNRYSTMGSSSICNAQPVGLQTSRGPFALAHNGNLVNPRQLREGLRVADSAMVSTSDSELIAFALQQAVEQGHDWPEAIAMAARLCQGAFSLCIGTPVGLFGLRDQHGLRPLVFGQITDAGHGGWVISSETCGLDIIGASHIADVQPGELLWFRPGARAPEQRQWITADPHLCIFEMIYFSRPDSIFFGESLYSYRRRLGERLAQESPVEADLVIGVPDSGIPAAIGYATASRIPFSEGLVKNRYVGRTFIQPSQAMREAGIRVKLNPLPDVLSGQRIAVIDDSIVRGSTSRKLIRALRDAGAREVHMRISSPPVTHPCFYGIDTDSQDQLIAANCTLEQIIEHLGVDSLAYLSKEGMIESARQSGRPFCSACFDGQYPVPPDADMRSSKLMLEPAGLAAQL